MKILLVSLLKRKITPQITASRPRFVFDLATEYIKKGHDVTILGTGDSDVPGANIIPVIEKAVYEMPPFENSFYAETSFLAQMAVKIKQIASDFDVIHNNCSPEFINLLIADQIKTPMVTTIHAPATPELDDALHLFSRTYLVSPSQSQKERLKKTTIFAVIPHGTDTNLYSFSEKASDYLLWVGRLGLAKNAEGEYIDGKGVRIAIAVAKAAQKKLILTGNVEDVQFFERDVKPFLNENIQWMGGVSFEQPLSKQEIATYMQQAKVLLITTRFDESFGLTAIESMSCGTPVIAFNKGAIPEIVQEGTNGFIAKDQEELVQAINKLYSLPGEKYAQMRHESRRAIEKNFSLERMADNYLQLYKKVSGM